MCRFTDYDFVVNSLTPEPEEARNNRNNIHSRNFTPGRSIKEDTKGVIQSRNKAKVLISAGVQMVCR